MNFAKVFCTLRLAVLAASFVVISSIDGAVIGQQVAPALALDTEGSTTDVTATELFDQEIAPLLVSHCLECHSGMKPEGGLSLATSEEALRGGDSGVAIDPQGLVGSLLWERVSSDEMPPAHPLTEAEKSKLKHWLENGAVWGMASIDRFAFSTDHRAGRDWWSLQPLRESAPPEMASLTAKESVEPIEPRMGNAIDAFVRVRLESMGLSPAPRADPRTLIRRVFFDLIGLPPTPEQVADFSANPTSLAYAAIVDELLASSHYGERWGRHWLDVVRFGESDGFERNFPRENAWPYRDWVINALNSDMPYDEFVRQQLIGDQITGGVEGAAATGFWTAGVHNTVVGGSQRMRLLARQDEIEDVLGTVGQTFLGLTINCARCHDHKFDPISQREFYQLSSAISGLGYGERVVRSEPELQQLEQTIQEIASCQAELAALDRVARTAILAAVRDAAVAINEPLPALARWEFDDDLRDSVGELHGQPHGSAHVEQGSLILDGQGYVVTPPLANGISEKTLEVWVQLDDLAQAGGAAISLETRDGGVFDAIVFGERDPKQWMAGSNSFARTDSFNGYEEADAVNRPVHLAFVYHAGGTIVAYRDGVPYGKSIHKADLQDFSANEAEVLFGLRHKPTGGNRLLKAKLYRAALYDRALTAEEVAASSRSSADYVSAEQIVAVLEEPQRRRYAELQNHIVELQKARQSLESVASRRLYTLNPGPGETTQVLLRGDPDLAEDVVHPAAMDAIPGLPGDLGLPVDAPEAERRKLLAQWITHRGNPLFARVMANRLWHYHFGVGIVDTPNDLGFNGGRPTHPELLEYLAVELQKGGFRLKALHRLIVTSQTYQQTAEHLSPEALAAAEKVDADNRWLWRGSVHRLEAEVVRDTMLSVAGQLNTSVGGPSFKDVSVIENSGTTYYEPIDAVGGEFWRRTVYRFNPRGGRSALLDTFDCPDPSASAPRRAVTTTPLQALSLLNNVFVLRMADAMAQRVEAEVGEDQTKQINRAWQLAIARDPNVDEQRLSQELVQEYGLASLCRGLFNFNEFVVH